MCRLFKIIYACGHTDDVKAPCEWRDEGMIDGQGELRPCQKSSKNLSDLTRHCMACSPRSILQTLPFNDGQDLIDIRTPKVEDNVGSYISCDEKAVKAVVIRNEIYLWKRAKNSPVIHSSPGTKDSPSSSEIQYQCNVNEEFLSRRLKRRRFKQHFGREGIDYQAYLEAAQAHLDARVALNNNSLFILQDILLPHTIIKDINLPAFQALKMPTANASTQTDYIEESAKCLSPPLSLESDDSSETIRPSHSQVQSDFLPIVLESSSSTEMVAGPPSQDVNIHRWVRQTYETLQFTLDPDINSEGPLDEVSCDATGSGNVELDGEEAQKQGPFAEWSGFIDNLSHEWVEGSQTDPEPKWEKIPLGSPEGIARLVDIRNFLCMSPDVTPLEIWNFVIRNKDLVAHINGNTIPMRHRCVGIARRAGFERDSGLGTVQDDANGKWELRKGFVDMWNSLNWAFEEYPGPGPDSGPLMRCDGKPGKHEEKGERQEHENEREHEIFPLEGRRVGVGEKSRVVTHQPRTSSQLRTSWTYAEPARIVSPTQFGDNTSLQLPSHFPLEELVPPLPLEECRPSVEPGEPTPQLSQESRASSSPSSDNSSSSSSPPRAFHRGLSVLVQADSTRGKNLLSHIRRLLAMPASKAPYEISLFIDLHPELMKAIRTGLVPTCKPPVTTNRQALRKQRLKASFDPTCRLKVRDDEKVRDMRAILAYALKTLDWDEIDSGPVPQAPLLNLPWDRQINRDEWHEITDDDEEEEGEIWEA